MEKLRRRKLNSVGSSGCDKKSCDLNITVAFLQEERFIKWKMEKGTFLPLLWRGCPEGTGEGFINNTLSVNCVDISPEGDSYRHTKIGGEL